MTRGFQSREAPMKNSRLPSPPLIGDSKMPATIQPKERDDNGRDIVADRGVHGGIAHHAFLRPPATDLELRLDQRKQARRPARQARAPPAAPA